MGSREYAVSTRAEPNHARIERPREKETDPSIILSMSPSVEPTRTVLVYEPAIPAGAPTSLGAGQLAAFFADEPFVVRSQDSEHPSSSRRT